MSAIKVTDINFSNLHLTKPNFELRKSFKQAVREHRRHKVEDFYYPRIFTKKQYMAFLKEMDDKSKGVNLPRGIVPSTAFWLTDGTHYLGSGDVRHYLNDGLKTFGGHIGYSVRPSVWNMGLGTLLLSLLLKEAAALGIATVRITCFEGNAASARVMEKNNAVLVDKVYNNIRGEKRLTRVYDITLK